MIEAKYTKLYKTWLAENHNESVTNRAFLISSFTKGSFTNDMATDLVNMLSSVYNYYEIGDNDEMLNFLLATFDEYYNYYYELISNYKKEYDYALNNKRVITKNDSLDMVGNTIINNTDKNKTTEYELPNKVVSEDYESTPSSITDNKGNSTNNKDYTNNTTRTTSTTTEFNNEFIDLKNKYIDQIRNIYREFAMKFKECFYQIY